MPRPSGSRARRQGSSSTGSGAPAPCTRPWPRSSNATAVLRNAPGFSVTPWKSNFGSLIAAAPSTALEGANVGPLMRADDVRLLGQRAVQRADALGLGVERGLEVLEREREVEDRHVARGRQPRLQSPAAAQGRRDRRCTRARSPAQEPANGSSAARRSNVSRTLRRHRSRRVGSDWEVSPDIATRGIGRTWLLA